VYITIDFTLDRTKQKKLLYKQISIPKLNLMNLKGATSSTTNDELLKRNELVIIKGR
jgi:hypothetical protein